MSTFMKKDDPKYPYPFTYPGKIDRLLTYMYDDIMRGVYRVLDGSRHGRKESVIPQGLQKTHILASYCNEIMKLSAA